MMLKIQNIHSSFEDNLNPFFNSPPSVQKLFFYSLKMKTIKNMFPPKPVGDIVCKSANQCTNFII